MLHGEEDAEQVHFQHATGFIRRDEMKAYERLRNTCIVDRYVEGGKTLQRKIDKPLGGFLIRDVPSVRHNLSGMALLQFRSQLLKRLRIVVREHQFRAFGSQGVGDRPAKSTACACQQHGASVKALHLPHFPFFCPAPQALTTNSIARPAMVSTCCP